MVVASPATRHSHEPKTAAAGYGAFIAAAAVLLSALAIAWGIRIIQAPLEQQPERAVSFTGAFLAAILIGVPGLYLLRNLRNGRRAQSQVASLAVLSTLAVVLLAIYFFWVQWYVFFPADILVWSEGDFINDTLKFLTGYPLYTPVANLDSTHYPPIAQGLTYLLAWMAGKGGSIPAYRVIQVVYTALAAFMSLLCCRRILRMAWPECGAVESLGWNMCWYAALFLMATNSITNGFAHNLHGDALAQLASMTSLYLLLVYIETRSTRVLGVMILLVPLDFYIKQNLLIWAVWYGAFLAVWGRSWKRLVIFAGGTAALFAASLAVSYAVWGQPFFFWIFVELSKHAVSPLRAFQHLMDSWPYFAAGLLGGMAILRGRKPELLGVWLIWLGLIASETYTSGIEWMLNHIGPGSLMAGVWFLAGLASVWDRATESQGQRDPKDGWIRAAALTATVALLFGGLGMVRIPLRPISDDAYRYVHDIENEFQGQPANRILLDTGTWVYAKDRVIMGDRAAAAGMIGMGKIDGFSGFTSRIAAHRYSKILVRSLQEPDFWYENSLWPKPSGIREALLKNYHVTGRIKAAEGPKDVRNWAQDPHLFGEISILEPNGE